MACSVVDGVHEDTCSELPSKSVNHDVNGTVNHSEWFTVTFQSCMHLVGFKNYIDLYLLKTPAFYKMIILYCSNLSTKIHSIV